MAYSGEYKRRTFFNASKKVPLSRFSMGVFSMVLNNVFPTSQVEMNCLVGSDAGFFLDEIAKGILVGWEMLSVGGRVWRVAVAVSLARRTSKEKRLLGENTKSLVNLGRVEQRPNKRLQDIVTACSRLEGVEILIGSSKSTKNTSDEDVEKEGWVD